MKNSNIYISLLFLFAFFNISGQEFHRIDSIVDSYPKSFSKEEKISERICSDFQDQSERARAIYAWIAKNVEYDVKAYYAKRKPKTYKYSSKVEKIRKEEKHIERVVNQTLRKKKALCYGYALLFKKVCDLSGIQCVLISGGDKTSINQIGKRPSNHSHAWNAIRVQDYWQFVDVTWGAGTVDSKRKAFHANYTDAYFCTSPEKFFLSHFPKDTSWILINKTKEDFLKLPLFTTNYLESDLKIVLPTDGVISLAETDTLNILISNVTNLHSVSYMFSNEKYSYEKEPIMVDKSLYEYEIVNKLKRNGYLTIYMDQKPIVIYKIIIKS
jgi:transglutaminase/protease-like cytokinesis protein 3